MKWLIANFDPIVYGVIILALLFAGWEIRGWKDEAALKEATQEALNARIDAEKDAAAVGAKAQETLNADVAVADKHDQEAQHETKNPGYDCPLPAGGVQLYRNALRPAAR